MFFCVFLKCVCVVCSWVVSCWWRIGYSLVRFLWLCGLIDWNCRLLCCCGIGFEEICCSFVLLWWCYFIDNFLIVLVCCCCVLCCCCNWLVLDWNVIRGWWCVCFGSLGFSVFWWDSWWMFVGCFLFLGWVRKLLGIFVVLLCSGWWVCCFCWFGVFSCWCVCCWLFCVLCFGCYW